MHHCTSCFSPATSHRSDQFSREQLEHEDDEGQRVKQCIVWKQKRDRKIERQTCIDRISSSICYSHEETRVCRTELLSADMSSTSSPTSVPQLFTEVNRLVSKQQDYEKALVTLDKILKDEPRNNKALHSRLVCLIRTLNFDQALATVSQIDPAYQKEVAFEKAYVLYRLNRVEEALSLLQHVASTDNRFRELEAQSLYRLERYEESRDTYVDLIKNSYDDYENEREANLSAAIAREILFSHRSDWEEVAGLTGIDSIIESVDVNMLEQANWSLGSKYVKKTVVEEKKKKKKKKKKRKRNKAPPKNYDPNVDPDPERWLPKWQRSAFKKRRDKRKDASGGVGKGSQGVVSDDVPEAPKPSPKPGASSLPPGPRQQQRQKKKKGRK